MYDLNSNNPNPVINYDGVSKNITSVGFHEDGRWMYTGGEDCMARIWDLRYMGHILGASGLGGIMCQSSWSPLSPQIKKSPVSEDISGQRSN